MQNFPINLGTLPAIDTQVNNPRLRGAFVNRDAQVQLLPNIKKRYNFQNARDVLQSTFNNRQIVATQREVFYIENENVVKVGEITSTAFPVRMDENTQNEVTIVNGAGAWVFQQRTGGFSKLDSANNGFSLLNPVDVCVLNTITIIVGGTDRQWQVSEANNAIQYDGQLVVVTDNSMGELSGCEDLNNNLYIFGTGGVQRWVPSIERLPTDFPFTEDPTYRDDFGCISTGSLLAENNEIFYLSSNGQIRRMDTAGNRSTITNDGIENIIANYFNPSNSFGAYFYHKGYYLYSLSFPDNKNTFVYCPLAQKWSESDDLWLGFAAPKRSIQTGSSMPLAGSVLLTDGVYELTSDYTDRFHELIIQTPYVYPQPPKPYNRVTIGTVYLELTQGKGVSADPQPCWLQMTKDNVVYGNRVKRFLSPTAKRLQQLRWFSNVSNNAIGLRFILQLKQEILITRAYAAIVP